MGHKSNNCPKRGRANLVDDKGKEPMEGDEDDSENEYEIRHLLMKDKECHVSSTEFATHLNKSGKVKEIIYSGLEAQLKEGSVIS